MLIWFKALIVAIAIAAGVGLKFVFPKIKDDNPIEEIIEEYIFEEAGINIDLTPASKED